jgi:hypothetical protein
MSRGLVSIRHGCNSAMLGDFQNSNSKVAGSILASVLVFLVGGFGAAFVAAAGGNDPVVVLEIMGGVAVLCISLLWLLNVMTKVSPKACYNWVFSKNARPNADYEPRRRNESRRRNEERAGYGTNHPSSVEELKEIRDDSRTWVPSSTRQSRSGPK